jgi:hypothetical protein
MQLHRAEDDCRPDVHYGPYRFFTEGQEFTVVKGVGGEAAHERAAAAVDRSEGL